MNTNLFGTLPNGRQVQFVPHPDAGPGTVLIAVDPQRLSAAWTSAQAIPRGGADPKTPGKRAGVERFLATGAPVPAPLVVLDRQGAPTFADGRHRFATLRDQGIDRVALSVPQRQADRFRELYGDGDNKSPGPKAAKPDAATQQPAPDLRTPMAKHGDTLRPAVDEPNPAQQPTQHATAFAEPTADVGTPQLTQVPDVEIFDIGIHHGEPWTLQDIQEAVENFQKLSTGPNAILKPPLVFGHEEQPDQQWLNRTDLPAGGIVTELRQQSTKLDADFGDVPIEVAKVLKQKAYRQISAELYRDFVHDGVHYGVVLKRVAALGGAIPEVKTLSDITALAHFADGQATVFCQPHKMDGAGTADAAAAYPIDARSNTPEPLTMAAGVPDPNLPDPPEAQMDRTQMIEALAAAGYDTSLITDQVPDAMLEETLKHVMGAQANEPGEPAPAISSGASAPMADDGVNDPNVGGEPEDPSTMSGECTHRHADAGDGPSHVDTPLTKNTDTAASPVVPNAPAQPQAIKPQSGGQTPPNFGAQPAKLAATPAPMPMPKKVTTTHQFTERRKPMPATKPAAPAPSFSLDDVRKIVATELAAKEQKLRAVEGIHAFCERNKEKILPAWLDATAGGPTLKDVLLAAVQGKTAAVKFGEGASAKEMTLAEQLMAVIERGPKVAKFTEIFADPHAPQGSAMTPERRKQLLSASPAGKQVLRQRAAAK